MRVIHLISSLDQGGAEAMLEKLLLTGQRMNPEIEQLVINLGQPGVVGERLKSVGVHVESLGLRKLSPRLIAKTLRLRRRLGGQHPCTIVQTWLWHADLLGGLCARAGGNRRVVWNLRNSMPQLATTKFSSRAFAYTCARLSRWIPASIVCNSNAALTAHTAIGYDRAKCQVIPNGFDLHRFAPSSVGRQQVRESWRAKPGEAFVGMVARVDPQKDHATFIRAAARIRSTTSNVRFVLVGKGVTTDAGIRKLTADLSLGEQFLTEERREDVQSVMNALDVFCLASKSEGFPNVLGEAMACGTPAISTDVGDASEILADPRLVAVAQDPESLAGCIRYVLSLGPEGRRALGLVQRQSVETRFDIEQIWTRYLGLYRSL